MDKKTQRVLNEFAGMLVSNDIENHYKTGSQVVRGVKPNDYDYVVYDSDGVVKDYLESDGGFEDQEAEHYKRLKDHNPHFRSYRKEKLNVIWTDNRDFYDKYVAATILLEKKQLKDKKDRITLFNGIMDKEYNKDFNRLIEGPTYYPGYKAVPITSSSPSGSSTTGKTPFWGELSEDFDVGDGYGYDLTEEPEIVKKHVKASWFVDRMKGFI